jgi:hypothetical protein
MPLVDVVRGASSLLFLFVLFVTINPLVVELTAIFLVAREGVLARWWMKEHEPSLRSLRFITIN